MFGSATQINISTDMYNVCVCVYTHGYKYSIDKVDANVLGYLYIDNDLHVYD